LKQINCYPQSLSPLSHNIGIWEKNTDEISMPSAPLNRLWLHCIAATIQVFHKRLRKLVNFSEMTGRKLFRDVDAECVRIQFLRCILDTRRRASILNEAISWIEGNAIFDDVCMSMLLRSCELFGSANLFEATTTLFDSKVVLNTQSLYLAVDIKILRFWIDWKSVKDIRFKIFCGKLL